MRWPNVRTAPEEFVQFAKDEGIACAPNPLLTWDEQMVLAMGIGVSVCFDRRETGILRLDSIQYLARSV